MGKPDAEGEALAGQHATLLRMVYGAQAAQIIYVAAKVEIADLLASGPRTSADLAAATTVDELTLRRLLRGLVSLGVCSEVELDRFALTELGQCLRSDHSRSLQARILFNSEVLWPIWGGLLDTIRTGRSGAVSAYGTPFYEYLQQYSDIGKLFDRTMADAIGYRVEPALDAYDFSHFRKVVDIGGGNGALILEMLKRCQGLEGIVFDLPLVAERARRNIAAMPESARCTVETGNALERVTDGADCYVMSNVLVSMVDAQAATILQNCRRAMAVNAKVVIIEWVMPTFGQASDPFTRWDTASMDLNMLAIHGSGGWRVRTRDEFRRLIEMGGFILNRIIPTRSSVSVLECVGA
jgi:hypothetical protein